MDLSSKQVAKSKMIYVFGIWHTDKYAGTGLSKSFCSHFRRKHNYESMKSKICCVASHHASYYGACIDIWKWHNATQCQYVNECILAVHSSKMVFEMVHRNRSTTHSLISVSSVFSLKHSPWDRCRLGNWRWSFTQTLLCAIQPRTTWKCNCKPWPYVDCDGLWLCNHSNQDDGSHLKVQNQCHCW